MIYAQIIQEIERLPVDEQLLILEAVTRSVRETLQPHEIKAGDFSAKKLRGILKLEGHNLSDEELKNDYISYLAKKYLS